MIATRAPNPLPTPARIALGVGAAAGVGYGLYYVLQRAAGALDLASSTLPSFGLPGGAVSTAPVNHPAEAGIAKSLRDIERVERNLADLGAPELRRVQQDRAGLEAFLAEARAAFRQAGQQQDMAAAAARASAVAARARRIYEDVLDRVQAARAATARVSGLGSPSGLATGATAMPPAMPPTLPRSLTEGSIATGEGDVDPGLIAWLEEQRAKNRQDLTLPASHAGAAAGLSGLSGYDDDYYDHYPPLRGLGAAGDTSSAALTGVLSALGRGELPQVKVELGEKTLLAVAAVGLGGLALAGALLYSTAQAFPRRRRR